MSTNARNTQFDGAFGEGRSWAETAEVRSGKPKPTAQAPDAFTKAPLNRNGRPVHYGAPPTMIPQGSTDVPSR